MKNLPRDEKGLSMIETIFCLTVFGMVSVLIFQCYTVGSRNVDISYAQFRLTGQARQALDRMVKELRNSAYWQVTVPVSNQVTFRVPQSISPNGVITWSGMIQYVLGGLNNRQILRQDLVSGASSVLASDVTALQFVKNTNPTTLSISLTTTGTTKAGDIIPIAVNGTVEFRNGSS